MRTILTGAIAIVCTIVFFLIVLAVRWIRAIEEASVVSLDQFWMIIEKPKTAAPEP